MSTNNYTQNLRQNHHKALETLADFPNPNGLKIWRQLRRLEAKAHRYTTAICNGGSVQTSEPELFREIQRIFGGIPRGFFLNGDARGHALKIQPEHAPAGIAQDWGRNGILAAEIN